ncbi:MAG: GNAT family N-acetyltransferase [Gemmatimonadaceae bacterium]
MPVGIRHAQVVDADAAAALYLRARRAAEPAIPPGIHPDYDVRRWMRERLVAPGHVWLAHDGNAALLGLVALTPGWVEQLYVEPTRTGEGIGGALLDFAKARSAGVLKLWTFAGNAGARRFYERHGFAAVEWTDGSGNEEGAPDVLYVWRDQGARPARS